MGVATEVINAFAPQLAALESLYKSFIEKVQQSEAEGLSAGQAASNNVTKLAPQAEAAASAKALEVAESRAMAAKKVNDVGSLSKGRIDHAIKRHLPAKAAEEIPFQLKKITIEAVKADLESRSYFNKSWNREQVEQAAKIVFDAAVKAGVKGNEYSMRVFGEEVTVYLDKNGILRSAWGSYKYQMSDFGY